MRRALTIVVIALSIAFTNAGCAGSMTGWLVNLRNSQGDSALENKNYLEAEREYRLALALAPKDKRARAGLAQVLYQRALTNFTASKLDYAESEIRDALKYAPDDPNAQGLASEIEQARIRRDIVISNYPSYETMGASIAAALKSITALNKDIQKQIKAFGYDYDAGRLTKAISEAYDLQDEMTRIAQRLISYKALVQAGAPKSQTQLPGQTTNLLPIP